MRILFLDAYFEPDQIAFTHLEHDLLQGLADAGHEIEIVCPTPTRGVSEEVIKKYKRKKSEFLYGGRVHVTRFSAPREHRNPIIRALRYFWCNIKTYLIGKKMKGIDAVFANSTPPTQGFMAGKVAKKQGVPFIYSLQDIFPDSLVNAKMTKEGSILWKIGRRIENSTYKSADWIVVISESFKRNLREKKVPDKKITVISNWIDLNNVHQINRAENGLFDELGIGRDKFIVLYAGNMGEMQGTEIILQVAGQLRENNKIQFVLFGTGSLYDSMARSISEMKLKNVLLHPLLGQDRVSEVYSMGDIALITCKKGTGNAGLPSKLWSIMACNTPVIASFDEDSELSEHIRKSGAGICVEPENSEALRDAIKLYASNENIQKTKGREYVENTASAHTCIKKYCEVFLNRPH